MPNGLQMVAALRKQCQAESEKASNAARLHDMIVSIVATKPVATKKSQQKTATCSKSYVAIFIRFLVGIAGFEPTTSASRRQRSTKLSYIPNIAE